MTACSITHFLFFFLQFLYRWLVEDAWLYQRNLILLLLLASIEVGGTAFLLRLIILILAFFNQYIRFLLLFNDYHLLFRILPLLRIFNDFLFEISFLIHHEMFGSLLLFFLLLSCNWPGNFGFFLENWLVEELFSHTHVADGLSFDIIFTFNRWIVDELL